LLGTSNKSVPEVAIELMVIHVDQQWDFPAGNGNQWELINGN
jgi:hypothetical protein